MDENNKNTNIKGEIKSNEYEIKENQIMWEKIWKYE